jgi:hypothetical protein
MPVSLTATKTYLWTFGFFFSFEKKQVGFVHFSFHGNGKSIAVNSLCELLALRISTFFSPLLVIVVHGCPSKYLGT